MDGDRSSVPRALPGVLPVRRGAAILAELSPARIAATVATITAHAAAALFLLAPHTARMTLPPAEEVTTVVEFIPAEGRRLVIVPPAPPPTVVAKPAKPAPAKAAPRTPPPAEEGNEPVSPAEDVPELLAGDPDLAKLDLPAPDHPPTEILSYRTSHQPAFPAESRLAGEGGWVTLRVLVDANGVPTAFVLVRSTATERLVEAAVEAIKHWRFNPAIKGGVAVPAWVEVPIGFYNSRRA